MMQNVENMHFHMCVGSDDLQIECKWTMVEIIISNKMNTLNIIYTLMNSFD